MFSIEPQNGVDKPQMNILVEHLTPVPTTSPPPGQDLHFVQDAHYGILSFAVLAFDWFMPYVAGGAAPGGKGLANEDPYSTVYQW